MEVFYSKYSETDQNSIREWVRVTQGVSVASMVVSIMLCWMIGYFKFWKNRADILCMRKLQMFLFLRVVGGLGVFPWWRWTSGKAVVKSQFSCAIQSFSQDTGNFGSFLEQLNMAYILFSLGRDICGFTFPVINSERVKHRVTVFICIISVTAAFILLYMRGWCEGDVIKLSNLHTIHFFFDAFVWTTFAFMAFWAGLVCCNRSADIRYRNSGRTISETEINASSISKIGKNNNNNIVNGKDIASNIIWLSSCIVVSFSTHAGNGVYLLIKGANAAVPPLWYAKLDGVLIELYPALISWIIIYKCSKYCNYKMCKNNNIEQKKNCAHKSISAKLSMIDVDLDTISSLELICSNNEKTTEMVYTIESSVINSDLRSLFIGTNERPFFQDQTISNSSEMATSCDESLIVNDRSSIDLVQSSCVAFSV